jgi:hypothetical protein
MKIPSKKSANEIKINIEYKFEKKILFQRFLSFKESNEILCFVLTFFIDGRHDERIKD